MITDGIYSDYGVVGHIYFDGDLAQQYAEVVEIEEFHMNDIGASW